MSLIKLQGETERRRGIYYQVDTAEPPIGEGGMGQVRRGICVDERTGSTRPVAIKFMFADMPAQAIERARREASIQLRNDNLVEMLGFIELDEQTPNGQVVKHYHVVSELLNGVSLDDLLEGRTKDRNGEDVPFAVKMLQDYKNDPDHFAQTIIMNVLSGLMALHDAGYIHRDIDPSNIMLTTDGHIKLIDFGIAKQMNTLTTSDKQLTVAGKFMGKPEYAAPELALGDVKHQNQTTDIYAVGILLYQCIVGHTPFEGARHDILEKQLKEKLPLSVIKNKALRNIIATACEKKQELRYQTAAQMRVALETMSGARQATPKSRKILLLAAAVAVLVIVVGGILFVTGKASEAEENKQQAEQMIFENEKAHFTQDINKQIAEADGMANSVTSMEDAQFASSKIAAYLAYAAVEETLARDDRFGLSFPEIAQKKQALLDTLKHFQMEFAQKVQDLMEVAPEMAAEYAVTLDEVAAFLEANK